MEAKIGVEKVVSSGTGEARDFFIKSCTDVLRVYR